MSDYPQAAIDLPESFIRHIKDALENLYDFAALERHPFARILSTEATLAGETAGQCLRRHILQGIDALNPGSDLTQHGPQSRSYDLLRLRYVEGMRIQEAADELGISERQAYRHMRDATEGLASVLWSRNRVLRQADDSAIETPPRPELTLHPVDLRDLIAHAASAVERLAETRGVSLQSQLPSHPVIVSTEPTVAKQVLVSTVSQCIQQAQGNGIALYITQDATGIIAGISFWPASGTEHGFVVDSLVEQLTAQIGITTKSILDETGHCHIFLYFPTNSKTLLVIDDDDGLARLIERYLTDSRVQVVIANTGLDGIVFAQDLVPDAIVIDVMMPGMDGWEVLQRLRTNPKTRDLPIIVCSIFNDPELAYSLGARLLLPKPLNQVRFFEALRQIGVL